MILYLKWMPTSVIVLELGCGRGEYTVGLGRHNPNDLPRLYNKCAVEGYDVAIGSRYVSGVNVVNWPMGRVLMSYFASKYVRIIT